MSAILTTYHTKFYITQNPVRFRVWVRVRIGVRISLRAYICKLDDLDDHLSWV